MTDKPDDDNLHPLTRVSQKIADVASDPTATADDRSKVFMEAAALFSFYALHEVNAPNYVTADLAVPRKGKRARYFNVTGRWVDGKTPTEQVGIQADTLNTIRDLTKVARMDPDATVEDLADQVDALIDAAGVMPRP